MLSSIKGMYFLLLKHSSLCMCSEVNVESFSHHSYLIFRGFHENRGFLEPEDFVESDLNNKKESWGKGMIDFSCFLFLFNRLLQLFEIVLNLFRSLRN